MIGYFKNSNALQIPALLLLTLLLKIGFISGIVPTSPEVAGGLLPHWLATTAYLQLNGTFLNVLAIFILTGTAFYADTVLANRKMFSRRHLLVTLCIIIFSSLFPSINHMSAAMLLLPLTVLLFREITRLYTTSSVRIPVINAGIIAGVCYLCYHPFIFLIPACFFGLAIMRTFRFSEWMLMLMGLLTPAYFVLSYDYLTDQWNPTAHLPNWDLAVVNLNAGLYWWLAIGTALLWALISLVSWQSQLRRMLIQSRKNWYVLVFMGVCCIPGLFIPSGNGSAMLTLLAFPAGSIMANAFVSDKRSLPQLVLFWLVLLMVGVITWGWKNGQM